MDELSFLELDDLTAEKNVDLIAYLNKVLGHQVNEKVWKWEFQNDPTTVFTLLKSDENIIATQSMLPIKLRIFGQRFLTSKSETSFLDPAYRGKKLFEKLYDFAIEKAITKGSTLIWGFTPAVKAWRKNFHFNVYENLINYAEFRIKYCSLKEASKNSKNVFYTLMKFIYRNYKLPKIKFQASINFKKSSSINSESSLLQPNDISKLYQNIHRIYGNLISLEMDADYLKWRTSDNPALSYKTIFFYRNETLVGYVIYTINNEKLMIADLTFDNDSATLSHIINHIINIKEKFSILYYWGNSKCEINIPVFNAFKKLGAKMLPDESRHLVFKSVSNELNSNLLNDVQNWYINGLWTEGFYI